MNNNPKPQNRRRGAADCLQADDDSVLTSPGFDFTTIQDTDLQAHVCITWHIGLTWDMWRLVAHAIGSVHDLYLFAGMGLNDPMLKDLQFLRQLAETHRLMALQDLARRVDDDAIRSAG